MPRTTAQAANAAPQMSPQQRAAAINAQQRRAVLGACVFMRQQIASGTITPTSTPSVYIPPRFVGLGMRFVIEISATIQNSGSTTISLTDFGATNLLGQVTFVDLNNYTRVQTIGPHLALLATAKRRHPYAATADWNQVATNNRSQMLNVPPATWPVFTAPATIATSTSGTVRGVFELPLAYSNDDLRGGVYLNVVNSTAQIGLTFNQNPVVADPADNTFAIYHGASGTAGSITSLTYTIYQEYLDQLPTAQGRVILPILDLSTVYELKNTNFTAMTQNQDFPISYANFRDFLSTFVTYNNAGTATGRNTGSDVNYWALQSANFTNLFKIDPLLAAQESREHVLSDLPAGCYYFPSRRRPISTTQYGNMELILNALTVNSGSYAQVFWEDFALQNTLVTAGSLAAS